MVGYFLRGLRSTVKVRHYNFCRVHRTLRITPTMAAGISDHAWNVREMLAA